MVEFLVKQGIDSISVNADVAKEISELVRDLEKGGEIGTPKAVEATIEKIDNKQPIAEEIHLQETIDKNRAEREKNPEPEVRDLLKESDVESEDSDGENDVTESSDDEEDLESGGENDVTESGGSDLEELGEGEEDGEDEMESDASESDGGDEVVDEGYTVALDDLPSPPRIPETEEDYESHDAVERELDLGEDIDESGEIEGDEGNDSRDESGESESEDSNGVKLGDDNEELGDEEEGENEEGSEGLKKEDIFSQILEIMRI